MQLLLASDSDSKLAQWYSFNNFDALFNASKGAQSNADPLKAGSKKNCSVTNGADESFAALASRNDLLCTCQLRSPNFELGLTRSRWREGSRIL